MKDIILNVISIIALIGVLILSIVFNNQFEGGIFFQIIGAVVGISGLIMWITAKLTLGKHFTMSTTPKHLVTKGIYSKLRHPMYYGGILIYLGIGIFLKSVIGLVLTIILIAPLLIYSPREEEKLLMEKYKEKYSAYKKKTGSKSRLENSATPFSRLRGYPFALWAHII